MNTQKCHVTVITKDLELWLIEMIGHEWDKIAALTH